MKKIINWFKQSNRYKHLYMGILVYMFYNIIISLYLLLYNNSNIEDSLLFSTSVGTISSFTHMYTAEYKDKLYDTLFDWKDILAGCLIPVLLTLATGLWIILK